MRGPHDARPGTIRPGLGPQALPMARMDGTNGLGHRRKQAEAPLRRAGGGGRLGGLGNGRHHRPVLYATAGMPGDDIVCRAAWCRKWGIGKVFR
ncbi:hypothetical protein AA13594_1123 [Gluconacetobacter azotocaptans DSM 13594]|nr:hypothetical protein AA13594_1123 [Gluconacetobacter azotocaptans DSM 13594]